MRILWKFIITGLLNQLKNFKTFKRQQIFFIVIAEQKKNINYCVDSCNGMCRKENPFNIVSVIQKRLVWWFAPARWWVIKKWNCVSNLLRLESYLIQEKDTKTTKSLLSAIQHTFIIFLFYFFYLFHCRIFFTVSRFFAVSRQFSVSAPSVLFGIRIGRGL